MSNWPAVDAALERLVAGGPAAIPDQVFAALADRIQSAIESPDETRLRTAAAILESLYREILSHAPPGAQEATRRVKNGEIEAAYVLGKASFAQLLAARAADIRADGRFLDHVSDRRYRSYISALAQRPLSGSELEQVVRERKETISRKLGVLRTLGLVVSRKQGNTVVNSLTPAAVGAYARARADAGVTSASSESARPPSLTEIRNRLPEHMQNRPPFQLRTAA